MLARALFNFGFIVILSKKLVSSTSWKVIEFFNNNKNRMLKYAMLQQLLFGSP
jgi:hypothetical protein